MIKTIKLADQDARNIISDELKTNLLVEAGAGSGKTSEMANRVIALVGTGYREIGEIVAITFTKKAANELQERVRRRLSEEYEITKNTYLKRAIDNYHECFIGTIHSFCTKLIKERPIEAKVTPDFDETDDSEDEKIRQKVWEEYVYYADTDTKKLLSEIDKFSIKEAALKKFLKIVCDNQDVLYEADLSAEVSLDEIRENVDSVFNELRKNISNIMPDLNFALESLDEKRDKLQNTILNFNRKIKKRDELTFEEKVKLIELFNSKGAVGVTQKCWAEDKEGKANAKEIGILMEEFRSEKIVSAVTSVNTYIYDKLLIPFVNRAKIIYRDYKNRNSKLNFQDLLIKASEMLKNNCEVREYFQNKYKTVLVDEFQDTDPIQAQLLMYLTGEDINEKNWEKIVPKEGSLFVVGDPKQSIYAFRRADIEIYERFKERIIATGGKCVELITNFRTVRELGDWYNSAFSELLNVPDFDEFDEKEKEKISNLKQAYFSEMSTINESLDDTFSGVFSYCDDAMQPADIPEEDGKNIAKIIKWLTDTQKITVSKIENNGHNKKITYSERKIEYSDIMILSKKKKNLTVISKIISESGIPVKVTGANVTEKTPSFVLLGNIIKMLAYPEENAYLYRVMSDFPFNFTSNELIKFVNLGGRFDIYFNFNSFYKENPFEDGDKKLFEKFEKCFGMLKRFEDYSKYVPCVSLIEKIIEETGIQRDLITSSEKITEAGGFASLIEKLRMEPVTDIWGLDKLTEEISNMLIHSAEEENDIAGGKYNAVRMINVHKAKGLEAPIVILAIPSGNKKPKEDVYTEKRTVKGETVYFGHINLSANPDAINSFETIKSDCWDRFSVEAKYKANLEDDRILYVAATRARNALIISRSSSKENPWEKLVNLVPGFADKLMKMVYEKEKVEEEISEELFPFDFIEKEISSINKKRNEVLANNKPTFKEYIPSEKAKKTVDKMEISMEFMPEIEKKIVENTVTIRLAKDEKNETTRLQLGTAVHRLFEITVKKEDTNLWLEDIEERTQLKSLNKDVINELLAKFKSSKLFDRISKSDCVYTEVPISFKKDDTYISGKIDLVFKEADKWVIVDYKTCDSGQVKKELYLEYMAQIGVYKEVWRSICGSDAVDTELFFVEKL